jgi:uncharacterized protein YodC (DUF2158 family)
MEQLTMSGTFKVGDVVQLKSGGPKMTVGEISSSTTVWCVWFVGDKKDGGTFAVEVLKLA